jgi:alpha-galactosidase
MAKENQFSREATMLYGSYCGITLQLDGREAQAQTVRFDRGHAEFLFNNMILASGKRSKAGEFEFYQWRLTNTGSTPSPVVSNFKVFSIDLPCRGHHAPRLHGFKGGGNDSRFPPASAWQPWSYSHPTEGHPGPNITAQSAHGRSSNDDCPFFVLENMERTGGWIIALGWSGDWQLVMSRTGEAVRLQIGMQHLHARLLPGESILQPELLVARYQGTPKEAWSELRACIRDHFQPPLEGRPLRPVTCWDSYYGDQGKITEASIFEALEYSAETDLDYVVLDGGWTGGGEDGIFYSLLPHIGSWRPDPKRFKQGLKRVVAAAKQHKRKLGLWFDIENANSASLAIKEYPELFFGPCPPFGNHILRLDTTSGMDWAFETIARNVSAANAKWIRWDFNSDPQSVWHTQDKPYSSWLTDHRLGITECRYIENLYKVFDRLRERFPDLVIENCASGGRRIDLGLVRRSHCDWFSDHSQSEAIIRSMLHGAGQLFPTHRLNTSFAHVYLEPNRPVDWKKPLPASAYLSHFGGNFGMSDRLSAFGKAGRKELRRYTTLFKKVSACFEDEFYPFGDGRNLFEGPAGIAGIDRKSGAATAILFGQLKGRTFEELPSELNDLMKSQPLIADEGSNQFVASAIWSKI